MLAFDDLEQWRRWQNGQQPTARRLWRQVKDRNVRLEAQVVAVPAGGAFDAGAPTGGAEAMAHAVGTGAAAPRRVGAQRQAIVVLDSATPSSQAAVLATAQALAEQGWMLTLVAPPGVAEELPAVPGPAVPGPAAPGSGAAAPGTADPAHAVPLASLAAALPTDASVVVSLGDHLPIGAQIHAYATSSGIPSVVVQHGALTPFSPPPPPGAHLAAWSAADLEFWVSGRDDVSGFAVGSQLLWQAARTPRQPQPLDDTAVFLGQMHGGELPARLTARTVKALRTRTPLAYRPHPAEADVLSRLRHERWRRSGLPILHSGSLSEINAPVVSHFSTGILEAVAIGLPAYGFCAEPPPWLEEFWDRYGVAMWGQSSPTAVQVPDTEPARALATWVTETFA